MSKTQNLSNSNRDSGIFLISAAIIIVITFLLFTPKISSTLFPFKRQAVYKDFIRSVEKDKKIDPQQFWEFREFYSPGYFTFSRDGLSDEELQNAQKEIGVDLQPGAITLPFAVFHSPKLVSLDALSTKTSINQIVNTVNPKDVILKNDKSLMYSTSGKTIKIVSIQPESEMKKTVGFFEYNGADKKITENKYWLNTTSLSLD